MRFRGTTLVAALLLSLSQFALSQGNGVSTTPPSPNTSDSPTKPKTPQPATVAQDGQTSSAESRLPNVKPGGKDDVNAIGNRAVGKGSKLGNWYSLETEIRMGKELAQQVEQNAKLVRDPVVNEVRQPHRAESGAQLRRARPIYDQGGRCRFNHC